MGEHEQILLADFFDLSRHSIAEYLAKEGHVIAAKTGSLTGVKRIVDDPAISFRVAIISAYLPKPGDGEKAAEYIRSKRPETVIISHSGRVQTFGDHNITRQERTEVLLETIKKV